MLEIGRKIRIISFTAGLMLGILGTASMFFLSIMKIIGSITIPWFAGFTTLSAIGTGLWLLLFAWIFSLITFVFILYFKANS